MTELEFPLSFTPHMPTYPEARAFLKVIQGVSYNLYRSMFARLWEQVGTPQATVQWTDPESWIPQRLKGEDQTLALKIWRESNGLVNPRHVRGAWYLCNKHGLIARAQGDFLDITQEGHVFLKEAEGNSIAEIDRKEGLLNLLKILSERGSATRSELMPDYASFCVNFTTYRTDAVHRASLYDRLVNLLDREYIRRIGYRYEMTDQGSAYLRKYASLVIGASVTSRQAELYQSAQTISKETREKLGAYLSSMDPYKFEHLVRRLLEEMGYENVTVTAPAGDGGVDVVADIEMGISSVREVVQVKRRVNSIQRPVLDGLRGSLYRFKAMRGTIITTGTFSQGAKSVAFDPGAPPVTLIDGEKLLDLLIQYEIGVTRKAVEYLEFDESKLITVDEEGGVQGV